MEQRKKSIIAISIFALLILVASVLSVSTFRGAYVNGTFNVTGNSEFNGNVSVIGRLNMTSNNVTNVNCILLTSGGQICDSP